MSRARVPYLDETAIGISGVERAVSLVFWVEQYVVMGFQRMSVDCSCCTVDL